MARAKVTPSLDTLEQKLDEVVEACREMEQLRENLRRLKRGSVSYLDVLPRIAVCNEVIKAKVESLTGIIDAIEDAMPDGD
jgi:hypothetical protein